MNKHAAEPALPQVLLLTVIYVAVATLVHAAIVLLAGTVQPWLEDEARSRVARRVLSLLLAAIAVWLLIVTKHPAS